jgi:hypothetical protein
MNQIGAQLMLMHLTLGVGKGVCTCEMESDDEFEDGEYQFKDVVEMTDLIC